MSSTPVRTLKVWRWKPIAWYNGFSSAERIRGWQVQWYLMMKGELEVLRRLRCEVCDATSNCQYHLENYFDPLHAGIPMCNNHHMRLHKRFGYRSDWNACLHRHGHEIQHWEGSLSDHLQADWATPLIEEHGEEVRTCTFFLPDELKKDFPYDQLHPLESDAQYRRDKAIFLETGKVTSHHNHPEAPLSRVTGKRTTASGRVLAQPKRVRRGSERTATTTTKLNLSAAPTTKPRVRVRPPNV